MKAKEHERAVAVVNHDSWTSLEAAQKIMGANVFDPWAAIRHFGVTVPNKLLNNFNTIPFSEAQITQRKDSHILAACFSLSILEVRRRVENNLLLEWNTWYEDEFFASSHREKNGWWLIRKTPVPDSTSKPWYDQLALLPENESPVPACIMVYAIIGHFLETGERLFPEIFVRCTDINSHGRRVYVGGFCSEGLEIQEDDEEYAYDFLGIASAVNPS